MAIIYSYPEKTSPSGGDFLVITDSEQTAPNKNRTKSLKLSDLADFVISSKSGITGGGTVNTIAMFTPTGAQIGNSNITQSVSGSLVTTSVAGNLTSSSFITGNATVTSDLTCNNEISTDTLLVSDSADIEGQLAVSDTATFSSTSKFFGNVTLRNSGLILVNNSEEYGFIQAGSQSIDFYIGDPVASNPPLSSELVLSLTDTEAVFKKGVKLEGYLKDGTGGAGAAGQVLSSTGTGVAWVSDGGGTVTGTGTANVLTKWNSAGTGIQDSIVFTSADGSNVGIGSPTFAPQRTLDVKGVIRATNAGQAFRAESGTGSGLATIEFENGSALLRLKNTTNADTVKIKSSGNSFINGGSLGIGSNNGSAKFTVDQGGSIPAAKITNTNSNGVGLVVSRGTSNTADLQRWQDTNNDIKSVVDSDGKIGVGLTNPLFDVDVKGAGIRATRSTSADGFAIVALNSLTTSTSACGIYYKNNSGQLILNDTTQNQVVKISAGPGEDSYVSIGSLQRFGVGATLNTARNTSKLYVKNGDIQIDRPSSGSDGGGLVLQTPDKQNRYKITIDNSGNLVSTLL